MSALARGASAALLLLLATAARAAQHVTMHFTGVVSRPAQGVVSPYFDDPAQTSFAGLPMTITLGVTRDGGETYVDQFMAQWSDQTYDAPFITGYSGDGLPTTPENENVFGFFSTVALGDTGGSLFITPTPTFIAATDGDFDLSFNFTYSSPHDPFSTFADPAISGGGTFDAFFTFLIDPVLGPYDADSAGPFTLTGLTQTAGVPAPQAWSLMILGFAAVGAMARRRTPGRNRLPLSPDAL
jgi:hypothetical protein